MFACLIVETNAERILFYNKLNEKIERVSKILHFCFVYLTEIAVIVPYLIITIVKYTIYDQADESFYLPLPVLYVFYISQIDIWFNTISFACAVKKNGEKSSDEEIMLGSIFVPSVKF